MTEPRSGHQAASPASLFVVRLSLIAGVLGFGAVTWLLHGQRAEPLPPADPALTWMVLGGWAGLNVAILFMARRYREPAPLPSRATTAIIGWALGEAAAFLGGVHYFIGGSPERYGMGLLIFAVTLTMFPIPREEAPRLLR